MKKINNPFKSVLSQREGFTMSELVVAVSLFIIVISISSGTFVQSLRSQRAVVTSTSVNSNITQAMERMAREIRTGYNFSGTNSTRLNFINSANQQVDYAVTENNSIERCTGSGANCAPITADKIVVTGMKFTFSGTQESDNLPPRITISIQVEGINNSTVNFQTTVSARIIGT